MMSDQQLSSKNFPDIDDTELDQRVRQLMELDIGMGKWHFNTGWKFLIYLIFKILRIC